MSNLLNKASIPPVDNYAYWWHTGNITMITWNVRKIFRCEDGLKMIITFLTVLNSFP